jgi:dienelactone hydrolase
MRATSSMFLAVAFGAVALAQEPAAPPRGPDVGVGKSTIRVGTKDGELEVFCYRPESWSGERILCVLHGVLRNADEYRDHAVGMADRFDALVVAPRFDAERFPSRRYQRGGVLLEDGTAAAPEEWTYSRIPEVVAWVRAATARPDAKLYVIGHSAGGQFVVRMSAFLPEGCTRLVAANPGSALLPVRTMPFGYGFGGLPDELASDERLQAYLAAPLTVYLGTADDGPDDYFDRSAPATEQGSGRHQRGLAMYWTARTLAQERGWRFGWTLVEAHGVGHDHERMFAHAACAVALFGAPSESGPRGK